MLLLILCLLVSVVGWKSLKICPSEMMFIKLHLRKKMTTLCLAVSTIFILRESWIALNSWSTSLCLKSEYIM